MNYQVLISLLRHGMFPQELPAPFDSSDYGRLLFTSRKSLPGAFQSNSSGQVKPYTSVGDHKLSRPGGLHRVLGIVNPIRFFNMAWAVAKCWNQLEAHFDRENFSASRPVLDPSKDRGLTGVVDWNQINSLRAARRTSGKYLLKADVKSFYPGIYTHSIPWALHTKKKSKNNRSISSLIGNLLDDRVMSLQDRQTNGIPIGPDTSLVLSEIILTQADVELRQLISLNGFRKVDDYELTFTNRYEAEEALECLQSILSSYDLSLNRNKTDIHELPLPISKDWTNELRRYNFNRSSVKSQRRDIIDYFSNAFRLSKENPSEPVVKYAIARVGSVNVKPKNFSIYEDILLQCASSEPGSIEYVLPELYSMVSSGHSIEKDKLQHTIQDIVHRYSFSGGGSQVAWALWMAISLEINLTKSTMTGICQMEDPVVPVLALDAKEKGLTPNTFTGDEWADLMTKDELYRENWLISYEANVNDWLPSQGSDHVKNADGFGFLKQHGISFYNGEVTPSGVGEYSLLDKIASRYN